MRNTRAATPDTIATADITTPRTTAEQADPARRVDAIPTQPGPKETELMTDSLMDSAAAPARGSATETGAVTDQGSVAESMAESSTGTESVPRTLNRGGRGAVGHAVNLTLTEAEAEADATTEAATAAAVEAVAAADAVDEAASEAVSGAINDSPAEAEVEGTGDGAGESATRSGVDGVIAGAGPVTRPGERPTVRLRDAGPEDQPRYAPEWLQLREPADAGARAVDLLDPLRIRLANLPGGRGGHAVHDLGCGTGSMGRWLAPRLDGAQHWILHDRDPYLLHFAAVASPRAGADGSRVTVETRRGDVARLTPDALLGASLVTASALLDVLTREEVETLAAACAGAGCPALLTLSVAGRVEFSVPDPLDGEFAAAFNDHQRRGGLLGPDAVNAACEAFAAHGATVKVHPSPWRLGPEHAALTVQWLRGWVGAAVEQRPELAERAESYLAARLAACEAGELRVTVHHSDLLALARPTGGA